MLNELESADGLTDLSLHTRSNPFLRQVLVHALTKTYFNAARCFVILVNR